MLFYFALGMLILAGLLLAFNFFAKTDQKYLLKLFKWLLFIILGIAAIYFVISGRGGWALAMLPVALPYLIRLKNLFRVAKAFSYMKKGGKKQSSEVETQILRMRLDHETGRITGEVISGQFIGSKIEAMNQSELVSLLHECQSCDSEGARIIENFLDRECPGWANKEDRNSSEIKTNDMDRKKAFEILGLSKNASRDEIKKSYHRLIRNLHPDHGGSTYLAAEINRAKEILLGED